MTKAVRWGILSAAKIAREWLCPAIHNSLDGHITAIASRTAGKAEAMARPYRDVKLFDDYDQLLSSPDIDAVYIPLPNAAHVEWTRKAMEAGKHVLCEKPLHAGVIAKSGGDLPQGRDIGGGNVGFERVHHCQCPDRTDRDRA